MSDEPFVTHRSFTVAYEMLGSAANADTFSGSTINLREIAESGIKMNADKPELTFPVLVDDLGGQVHDYYTWRIRPVPFKIELGRIVVNQAEIRGYHRYGLRQRRYDFLDKRTLAEGGELDGPRL